MIVENHFNFIWFLYLLYLLILSLTRRADWIVNCIAKIYKFATILQLTAVLLGHSWKINWKVSIFAWPPDRPFVSTSRNAISMSTSTRPVNPPPPQPVDRPPQRLERRQSWKCNNEKCLEWLLICNCNSCAFYESSCGTTLLIINKVRTKCNNNTRTCNSSSA